MANWPDDNAPGVPLCPDLTMYHWIKPRSCFGKFPSRPAKWCAHLAHWEYVNRSWGVGPNIVFNDYEYCGPCKSPDRGNSADKSLSFAAWKLRSDLSEHGWTQEARQMDALVTMLVRNERRI
jgi:hypothetical protein